MKVNIRCFFLISTDYQDMFSVSVLFAFQTFFKNDVTCLTGLITLVDPSCFNSVTNKLEEEINVQIFQWNRNSFKVNVNSEDIGRYISWHESDVSSWFTTCDFKVWSNCTFRNLTNSRRWMIWSDPAPVSSSRISCCCLQEWHWNDCGVK